MYITNRCLSVKLEAKTYGFKSDEVSSIWIKIDGEIGDIESTELDPFFAFSIDDEQYISFVTDLDGLLWVYPGFSGIGIYPGCGSNDLAFGNASMLMANINASTLDADSQRDTMADGDQYNWYTLSTTPNNDTQPITFEFINDDIENTFTFKFISATFPNGLNCTYNASISIQKHFTMFTSPHLSNGVSETWLISNITVTGYVNQYVQNRFDGQKNLNMQYEYRDSNN